MPTRTRLLRPVVVPALRYLVQGVQLRVPEPKMRQRRAAWVITGMTDLARRLERAMHGRVQQPVNEPHLISKTRVPVALLRLGPRSVPDAASVLVNGALLVQLRLDGLAIRPHVEHGAPDLVQLPHTLTGHRADPQATNQ